MQNKTNKPYKVEPSVIVFVFIILALLLGRTLGGIFPMPQIVRWLGLVLSAVGLGLGLLALREFKRMRTFSKSKAASSNLVTTGIYGYTRNPVNLGFLLILIGLPFTGGSYWGILLMPMFIVAMNSLVILPEETYLESKFKDEFTKYKSKVRRWI